MVRLDEALAGTGAWLILQVHDELVVEAPPDKAEETMTEPVPPAQSGSDEGNQGAPVTPPDGGGDTAGQAASPDVEVINGEIVVEQPSADGQAKAAPEPGPEAPPAPLAAELNALRTELDERIADLQRVSAEYANYRKRVERDRAAQGLR